MRVASVRAARRKLVKLFKKPKSKFYWYDFTVRGRRYRASTQETKSVRALQIASLKLASVMEKTDPLPTKPVVLHEFANHFLDWVNEARLEEKTRRFYRNGWRLLQSTSVAMLRVDQITGACAEQLKFPGSAANANCALRTLRRMLHKAEERKVISNAPKIKMMREHGRHLRLDDEAERRLIMGAFACNWRLRTRDLFRPNDLGPSAADGHHVVTDWEARIPVTLIPTKPWDIGGVRYPLRVTGTYQVAGESAVRTFSARAAIDAQVSKAIYEMGIASLILPLLCFGAAFKRWRWTR
jgi:hypothetical protein